MSQKNQKFSIDDNLRDRTLVYHRPYTELVCLNRFGHQAS